ncbi:MAG: S1/P1 nuclease, partial [Candidatus Sulfotelmatobacter sp.]
MSLAFSVAFPQQLWGWGNSGHESVAYIAWKKMTPATRTRVMVLLKLVPTLTTPTGKTVAGYDQWVKDLPAGLSSSNKNLYLFMRAATWADSIKHVGFTDSDVPPAGVTDDVNIGFTDTKSHGYWHFIDTGFSSDSPAVSVPATPSPNVVTQIIALRTAIGSSEDDILKAYDLVWLE